MSDAPERKKIKESDFEWDDESAMTGPTELRLDGPEAAPPDLAPLSPEEADRLCTRFTPSWAVDENEAPTTEREAPQRSTASESPVVGRPTPAGGVGIEQLPTSAAPQSRQRELPPQARTEEPPVPPAPPEETAPPAPPEQPVSQAHPHPEPVAAADIRPADPGRAGQSKRLAQPTPKAQRGPVEGSGDGGGAEERPLPSVPPTPDPTVGHSDDSDAFGRGDSSTEDLDLPTREPATSRHWLSILLAGAAGAALVFFVMKFTANSDSAAGSQAAAAPESAEATASAPPAQPPADRASQEATSEAQSGLAATGDTDDAGSESTEDEKGEKPDTSGEQLPDLAARPTTAPPQPAPEPRAWPTPRTTPKPKPATAFKPKPTQKPQERPRSGNIVRETPF